MMLLISLCLLSLAQVSLATTTGDYTTDLPGCDMAVMKVNFLLTGILVPWFLALFFCIIDCCLHKRSKHAHTTMLFQPAQPAQMMVAAPQQVFSPQPMNYGMAQPNMVPGYAGYH